MGFALNAGELFEGWTDVEFKQCIVTRAIDVYIESCQKGSSVDPRVVGLVQGVVDGCLLKKEYTHVLGIAIESLRIDLVERVLGMVGFD